MSRTGWPVPVRLARSQPILPPFLELPDAPHPVLYQGARGEQGRFVVLATIVPGAGPQYLFGVDQNQSYTSRNRFKK